MGNCRYQVLKHNGVNCLYVVIDVAESDCCAATQDTFIPLDDIQEVIRCHQQERITQEQEDIVRRIVAEEIKQLEKRITNVVIYDLSQRMKQLNGKKEQ